MAGELGRLSGGVDAGEADASTAARQPSAKEPEMTTTAAPATQSSALAAPATQSSAPDAPMDKRDDVTLNTPSLVAARLVSKVSSFGHKVGAEV